MHITVCIGYLQQYYFYFQCQLLFPYILKYYSFSAFFSVTGTPQNVQYVQTEDDAVNISWSPPQGNSNNLYYSVFIKTSDENITRVKYVADTSVALTGLEQEAYNVIVVATKPSSRTTLPSFPQTIDITLGKLYILLIK